MGIEGIESSMVWLATGGSLGDTEKATELLRQGGFGVITIPVSGLDRPEATFQGSDYFGLEELVNSLEAMPR